MIVLVGGHPDILRGIARGIEARGRAVTLAPDVDVTSMRAVRAAVLEHKPVAAVLVGAWEDPDLCEQDPDRAFMMNTESAIHLAAACLEAKAQAILLSTAEVYGQRGGPWTESDEPAPISTYGRTKRKAEEFLLRTARSALVLRTGPILGDRLEAERALFAGAGPIEVPDDERVQPIAAHQVGWAIEMLVARGASGIFHAVASDQEISRLELLSELARLVGAPSLRLVGRPGRLLSRLAPRAPRPVLFGDKLCKVAETALGSWREGLDLAPRGGDGPKREESKEMGHRQEVRRVDKPWGHEIIWAHTDRYVGKLLFIKAGERLSLQYHEKKDETIYLLSGKMVFEVGPKDAPREDLVLRAGDSYHITPLTTHRMIAIEDTSILEASTPELDDVVRLEDKYGRAGTKAP